MTINEQNERLNELIDRTYPCCMCPAAYSDFQKKEDVCDNCGFLKTFEDDRSWRFFVKGGIGGDCFKTFLRKLGSRKEQGCSVFQWCKTFTQAQVDLNEVGKARGWREVQKDG